jgi:hypothetical protein
MLRVRFEAITPTFERAMRVNVLDRTTAALGHIIFIIKFHLWSVPIHSAYCVKSYTMSRIKALSSAHLCQIVSRHVVNFGTQTYELNFRTSHYKYDNYVE